MHSLMRTLSGTSMSYSRNASALLRMESDADMKQEIMSQKHLDKYEDADVADVAINDEVPLNVVNFSHKANAATRRLCEEIGGVKKLKEFTAKFYEIAFNDPHLDKFIREHGDHHGERFAYWIAEKMGLGFPWTEERSTRTVCPFTSHGYKFEGAHDRSSAHFMAWHSPKRDAESWGEHFKLDDCRLWMRLHFWAARETGVLDTPFGNYYVRFIGHFVSVYERTAPAFARDSARWSQDPTNIQLYLDSNRTMLDIIGLSHQEALTQLPEHERHYTGSAAAAKLWPYELSPSPRGFTRQR